ncbi:MAG TPA: hypothetical protein VIR63_05270, partial [Pontiella sp.]
MTKIRWFSLFFVVAGVFSASAAFDVDVPKEIPDEPFDLTAARLEYTNDVVLASGGVTGRFENVKIFADQIAANTQSGNLTIKGNILFERDNVIWKGSYLDYNYISQTGNFGPSLLNFDPVLMSVEHMERVSSNEYVLKGATFTSCTNAQPHFYVRAQEARLVDEKYLTAKGVKVYA